MREYIVKRLLLMVPSLIGVSLIVFTLAHLLPGDVVLMMLSEVGSGSSVAIEELRRQLGLDKPLHVQYLTWMAGAVRGDLGQSLWTRKPVMEEILSRLPVSLELALLAMSASIVFAIVFGVLSAVRQDTALDYSLRLFAIGFLSVPEFVIGTLLIILPALWWNYMPPITFVSFFDNPLENLRQYAMPAISVGLHLSASTMRMTRSSMLEVMRQDYIRTAWAKGLREVTVIYRHALKNALIPVATIMGAQLSRLIGGQVVVESIFGLPGFGRLMLESIQQRDLTQLQGNIVFIAVVFLVMNLVVDLTYAWMDPRIRY